MSKFKYTTERAFIGGYTTGLEDPFCEELYRTVEEMEKHGGGFVQSLANSWRHADPINKRKLVKAFPAYFTHYFKMTANKALVLGTE